MKRSGTGLAAALALGLVVAASPLVLAQAELAPTEVQVRTLQGTPLSVVAVGDPVEIALIITNEGEADDSTAPVDVEFRITGPSGNVTEIVRTVPNRTVGGVSEAVLVWQANTTGSYTVRATLLSEDASVIGSFDAAKNAVPAGSLAERAMDFPYFFIAFVGLLVLFVVVVVARRA